MITDKQALHEAMWYACSAIHAHKAYVITRPLHRITMCHCPAGATVMHIGLVYIGFEQDQPGAMTGLAAQVATALAFALAVAKGPDTLALAAVQQPDASRASTTRLG